MRGREGGRRLGEGSEERGEGSSTVLNPQII